MRGVPRGAGTKPSSPIISISIVLRLTIRANSAGPTLFPACERFIAQRYRGQSLVGRIPIGFPKMRHPQNGRGYTRSKSSDAILMQICFENENGAEVKKVW